MAVLRDWHSRRTRLEGEGGARGPGKFAGRGRGVPCWSASEEAAHTGRPHAGRASWWTLPFGLAGARGTRCSTLFTPFEGRLGGSHSSRLIRGRVTHARTRNARKKGFSLSLATNNTLLPSSWLAGEPNLHRACRRDHRRPRCRWRMRDPHLRPTLAGAPSRRLAARRVPLVLLALGAFLLPFLDLSLSLSLSLLRSIFSSSYQFLLLLSSCSLATTSAASALRATRRGLAWWRHRTMRAPWTVSGTERRKSANVVLSVRSPSPTRRHVS